MNAISDNDLGAFINESNHIEGIEGVGEREWQAYRIFVDSVRPNVSTMLDLLAVIEPAAVLRDHAGLDVRVGTHIAPPGGPAIAQDLGILLKQATDHEYDPYKIHMTYETLHPFTDGNGRTGRALWLWQMLRDGTWWPRPSFLQAWYYQSLQAAR